MRNRQTNSNRVKATGQATAADLLGKLQTPFFNRLQQLKPLEQREVLLQLTANYSHAEHFGNDAGQLHACLLKIIDTCTTHNINVGMFNNEIQFINSLAQRYEYISGLMAGE